MKVRVLSTVNCIEIDDVPYHHHPNGGGLVAEGVDLPEEQTLNLFSVSYGQTTIPEVEAERKMWMLRNQELFFMYLGGAKKAFGPTIVTRVGNAILRFAGGRGKDLWLPELRESLNQRKHIVRSVGTKGEEVIRYVLKEIPFPA